MTYTPVQPLPAPLGSGPVCECVSATYNNLNVSGYLDGAWAPGHSLNVNENTDAFDVEPNGNGILVKKPGHYDLSVGIFGVGATGGRKQPGLLPIAGGFFVGPIGVAYIRQRDNANYCSIVIEATRLPVAAFAGATPSSPVLVRFFKVPFARSGTVTVWGGLSKMRVQRVGDA